MTTDELASTIDRDCSRRWRVVHDDAEIAFHHGDPKVGDTLLIGERRYTVLRLADGNGHQRCVIVGDPPFA